MKISGKFSHFLRLGIVAVLFIAGFVWLIAGRVSLFESSSYTSRFASDKALELYRQNVLWLGRGSGVYQTFTAVYPGLYQVSIFFADNTRESPQNASINFYLKERCNESQNIRHVTAAVADIEDDRFYPFTFAPINESAGQTYCFVVEPVRDLERQSFGVWASAYDVYPGGQAYYQPSPAGEVKPPELSPHQKPANPAYTLFLPLIQAAPSAGFAPGFDAGFQVHYNGRSIDGLGVFMDRLVSHKFYFWGNKVFYILLVGFYLVGVFFLARVKSD
jgi:hypothetical protein